MKRRRLTTFDPTLSKLVGSTFVNRLNDRTHAPLRIGSDVWTVHELATQVGVVNTRAARILSEAVRAIGVKNLRDLHQKTSPRTFSLHGVGDTTLYVLWRVFQSRGLDPETWSGEIEVSFNAMKHRDQQAEKRTRDEAKKRQRKARRADHEAAVAAVMH